MNNQGTTPYGFRWVATMNPLLTQEQLLARAHESAARIRKEKILDAEARCSKWLADANELEDRARDPDLSDSQRFHLCYRSVKAHEKSQYWLDRLNKLTGRA